MSISRITHKVFIASLAFFCLSLAAKTVAGQEESAGPKMPLAHGYHQLEFALGEGPPLRSSVWVPKTTEERPLALVVALHWGGEVTPFFGMGILRTLAVPAFEDLNAIIVAPDCPGKGWSDSTSEHHVLSLLKYAVEKWPIDTARIVITGYSMGGMGSWFFASRHPDLLSAAVPVAGKPTGKDNVRVPVYAINGRHDTIIDLGPTQRAIKEMRADGVRAELVIVTGATHYETGKFVSPLKKATEWLQELWNSTY